MEDARDALMVARTTDGRLVRRPLSPHLQVYKPQITSVLSIMNRATGIALSAGMLLFVAAASSDHAYATVSAVMRSWIGLLVLFGWVVSLWYHFFAGVRHLAWDSGYGFDLRTTHRSGWAAVAATGAFSLLTLIAMIMVL